MFCKRCGNRINEGDKFCNGCGNLVMQQVQMTQQSQTIQPQQQVMQQPIMMNQQPMMMNQQSMIVNQQSNKLSHFMEKILLYINKNDINKYIVLIAVILCSYLIAKGITYINYKYTVDYVSSDKDLNYIWYAVFLEQAKLTLLLLPYYYLMIEHFIGSLFIENIKNKQLLANGIKVTFKQKIINFFKIYALICFGIQFVRIFLFAIAIAFSTETYKKLLVLDCTILILYYGHKYLNLKYKNYLDLIKKTYRKK